MSVITGLWAGPVTVSGREGTERSSGCRCGLVFLALSPGDLGHQSGLQLLMP